MRNMSTSMAGTSLVGTDVDERQLREVGVPAGWPGLRLMLGGAS